MFRAINIAKILRIMLVLLTVCCLLTACSDEGGNVGSKNNPLGDSQGQTVEDIAAEQKNCWQSSILEMMYTQMGVFALSMYKQICTGSLSLMLLAFCIWLSFRLLRHVSSFQEENIAETWTEILKQLLLCFVCGFLANSSDNVLWVLNHVIFPLFYAFLEFGSQMLNLGVAGVENPSSFVFLGENVSFDQSMACVAGELKTSTDAFPQAPLELLSCLTCTINERLGAGMTAVFSSLRQGGFMTLIVGFVIYCIFWFVKISFIFYMVDSLFRFTIMVGLLPLLILSYAFKKTRSLCRNGFIAMIASAAYLMMVAFVIAVCLLALQTFMQMPELGLNSSNPADYEADFKTFSVALICLLLMAFLCASTMSIAKELTNEFVGNTGNDNFQKQAGKLVAMIGKAIVGWLTAGAGNLLMHVATIRKTVEKINSVKGNIADKMNKLAGREKQ